ncbi:mRNA capping enzyme, alpha subunit [Schizopora paradoxa]|uniref:mRNA-capping enzyme subunit alpha n=1 Tax=Schizopora paradoxa TaxID=27342 RepID=A0A0H2S3R9_9AGAM|nr:mRNA capping enzyme, alpha subunit [Schizopora paradoxa]
MPHIPQVPELPGDVAPPDFAFRLRAVVAQLCNLQNDRFPGSQPVSFAQKDLDVLEKEDYWVCEKSDGVRVLFFVHTIPENNAQEVYLINRHNEYRLLNGFFFPHHENPHKPLGSTILDGELVIDTDPRTGQSTLRMLAFDCLVIDGQNVMSRMLDRRYGRLQEWFYKPYKKMMLDHPRMADAQPFDIKVKTMTLSYGVDKVFNEDIPKLQHGNDGLIYTCMTSPYTVGTDPKIKKWKPPSENSIDFKLVLRFPEDPRRPGQPDLLAKPLFGLHVFCGGRDKYEPFDEMYVDDEEWESLKRSGEQVDDRIVEVYWETGADRWRMMRFRDDKPNGNHSSVVNNIIDSIIDGVEKEDLLARTNTIRTAWKARASGANGQPSAQQHQNSRPPPPPPPAQYQQQQQNRNRFPPSDLRYGPLQESPYSRVGGPRVVFGFHR